MRQATMLEPRKIEIRTDAKAPLIKSNEVMVKISHIGVCGSDIHVNHGKHPFTSYPVIQGHEFSGHIIEVGKDVSDKTLTTGQLVTALPQITCGKCAPCTRGDFNICDQLKVRGFQAPGVAQDIVALPEDMIIKLPKELSPEVGAFIEPVSVAVHAVSKVESLSGKNILVTGAGTIGNLIAQVVNASGGNVLISDVSDFRLLKAKECGIEHVVNPVKENLQYVVDEAFGSKGFDIAFEVAGVEVALDNSIQLIEKGGTIIVVAVYGDRPSVDMSIIGDRELSLKGTLMYKHQDYQQAVDMLRFGDVDVSPLITKTFAFEDYMDAYDYIDSNPDSTMKAMIKL